MRQFVYNGEFQPVVEVGKPEGVDRWTGEDDDPVRGPHGCVGIRDVDMIGYCKVDHPVWRSDELFG